MQVDLGIEPQLLVPFLTAWRESPHGVDRGGRPRVRDVVGRDRRQ